MIAKHTVSFTCNSSYRGRQMEGGRRGNDAAETITIPLCSP